MKRLNFQLPEFTRTTWVTASAERVWKPRIDQILACWREIEWQSVAEGLRACALQAIDPSSWDAVVSRMAKHDLAVLELDRIRSGASYSATQQKPEEGEPFTCWSVIGSSSNAEKLADAWRGNQQTVVGELLGYPPCCTRFFQRVWVEQQFVDTTWFMDLTPREDSDDLRKVAGSPESNILLRWLGVRSVPHLPCSFDCDATVSLGRGLVNLGRQLGFDREMQWLMEMLDWPVEWSSLHGIAEVRTPVFRITTTTDAVAEKLTLQRHSDCWPDDGARGLRFPFELPGHQRVSDSSSFKRGLANPIVQLTLPQTNSGANATRSMPAAPDWHYRDNGFPSLEVMRQAHAPIAEFVSEEFSSRVGTICDLGCGNGMLLGRIKRDCPNLIPHGVDVEPSRIEHAGSTLAEHRDNFSVGDLFDYGKRLEHGQFDIVVLMPGRLTEADPTRTIALRRSLQRSGSRLLVYAYGDWLDRYGSLDGLCAESNLSLLKSNRTGCVGWAEVA